MSAVIDIETCPLAREIIEAAMPESLRNPVMPEEIEKPEKPDLAAKCPKYAGDEEKRAQWLTKEENKWVAKSEAARVKWKADTEAAREKYFRDAALDAKTGFVKLIVLRDTMQNETTAFLFEADGSKQKEILGDAALSEIVVAFYDNEGEMIRDFLKTLHARMKNEKELEGEAQCVGYYIKEFDLPFLYRRAWMNGQPLLPMFRKGRYWSEEVVDLHEMFAFGDRQYKVGGLDGLATALGSPVSKLGDGALFSEWYNRSPVEGILYCIGDVAQTEDCGRRMGVVK